MDRIPARTAVMAEMVPIVAMPVMAAIGIPEEAVVAPIAVIEGTVIAIIITVIIGWAAYRDRDSIMAVAATASRQYQGGQTGRRQKFLSHLCLQISAPPSRR